ncbi:MAG: 16S rRNA processing protein RimM [Firmicutes bacterium]|nr:16S rRNA processing protein RimM [Bacillota bacterium]
MNEPIRLGRITAPVGIKGEMRVYPYTDDMTRFSDIKKVLIEGREYPVSRARYQKDMVVLKLEGIDDRNAAETMRNKELLLDRKDLWEVPEDTYFIDDIMGIGVRSEDGSFKGFLTDVIQSPAHDLYEISPEGPDGSPNSAASFLLPAVKEFVISVDLSGRVMTVRLIEGMTSL